jgi:hypothetical protein
MENEYGECTFCKELGLLQRTYHYYDVDCECCSGDQHFEIVWNCHQCIPYDMGITNIELSNKTKHKI